MTRTLWRRLKASMRDPEMRANVLALAGGKAIGLTLVLTAMSIYLPPALHAQAAPAGPSPEINALNTVWVLLAAFLVFCMQVGFVMLEAGFARSRESINILVEGIVDTCICGVTFWAWGFAFMFEPGNGFIGTTGFFLKGLPDTYMTTGVPLLAFWVFQFAFADTCSTITSGAMVGRCGFVGDILYSIGVTGLHLPNHRSLGLGTGRMGGDDEHPVPRLRRFDSGAQHRRRHLAHGRHRARSTPGPRVPQGRRRPTAPAQHYSRRRRRVDSLVRLVRASIQAARCRPLISRVFPRLIQHDDGGVLGGSGGALLRLRARRQVGSRDHDKRIPRRARGHHVPVLLGLADRRVLHRHRRRRGGDLGDRRSGVPAH